jgi:hypothetical protein
MQVGDIFHGSEHYGGSYHNIGLYQVVKLGKKFASLKQIKSKVLEKPIHQVSPADSSYSVKCQACMPITFMDKTKRPQLVSFDDYDEEDKCAIVDNGGAQCTKNFEFVKKDEDGNFSYIASGQQYS